MSVHETWPSCSASRPSKSPTIPGDPPGRGASTARCCRTATRSTVILLSYWLGILCRREYGTLLSDCHALYCEARQELLGPVVQERLQEYASQQSLASTARSGCAYLMQVREGWSSRFPWRPASAALGWVYAVAGEACPIRCRKHGFIRTTDQSYAGNTGIFSRGFERIGCKPP